MSQPDDMESTREWTSDQFFFLCPSELPLGSQELFWMLFRRWQTWLLEPEVNALINKRTHTRTCCIVKLTLKLTIGHSILL